MKFNRKQLLLYAVTNRGQICRGEFLEQIEAALAGGITCLQLREKDLAEDEFAAEAVEVKKLCRKYGVPLIINDSLNVALKVGADGVHVGQGDLSAGEIRRIAGNNFIIGVTAKTVEQAKGAQRDGADYLGVGAVFPSPTKKDAIRITTEQLRSICHSVSIPAVAIGGIHLANAEKLRGGGMSGIAVVSALFASADIKQTAEALREKAAELISL